MKYFAIILVLLSLTSCSGKIDISDRSKIIADRDKMVDRLSKKHNHLIIPPIINQLPENRVD